MINRHEIATGFREFMNEAIDPRIAAYSDDHEYVLGQLFMLVKESTGIIGNMDGTPQRMEFSFPIAKVLQVGRNWRGTGYDKEGGVQRLQVGSLIRMRDHECKTSLNPAWEVWNSQVNAVKNGNMVPIGEAPPMFSCNMRDAFGRRVFNPDPFNLSGSLNAWGWDIFYFDQANVVTGIKDPVALLDIFLNQVVNQNQN